MLVATGAEGGLEDGIGVAVVQNHDVLVPTTRLDGEASTITGVQLADGIAEDMEFICEGTIVDGYAFILVR